MNVFKLCVSNTKLWDIRIASYEENWQIDDAMKLKNHPSGAALAAIALFAASPCYAAITWTGASDASFWNPANWSGGAPSIGGITNDNIVVSTSFSSLLADFSTLTLGIGFSMTVTNTNIDFIGAAPKLVQGIVGGTANSVNLTNSNLRTQSIAIGITANLTGTSQLSLGGINRAINSAVEISTVNMGAGTVVVFEPGSNDPSTVTSGLDRGNGWSIFNTASGQSFSTDQLTAPLTDFVLAGFDTTPFRTTSGGDGVNQGIFSITAIPEPSAALLGGFGALALLRRRRI